MEGGSPLSASPPQNALPRLARRRASLGRVDRMYDIVGATVPLSPVSTSASSRSLNLVDASLAVR
jgi:hypothetical protein